MQTTEEGEYVPEKELDKNYKIPKKKDTSEPQLPPQVLEASYPAPPCTSIDAARDFILDNITKRKYEQPKLYRNHILKDTIPDCFDESLPRELTSLFQPLYCKLCLAQLSSNVVAKLHYKSKNHEKKIRKFLIEHAESTGEPLHKRARIVGKPQSEEEATNPLYFYCNVCDLPLTGKLHAESHYLGRNHRKATLGLNKPAGKGHYDQSGKWVRDTSSSTNATDDGFGVTFRAQPAPVPPPTTGFRCELCNVTTTCREQLENHHNGQKHRKKLKLHGVVPALPTNDTTRVNVPVGDCSVYRTPSGNYYCHICNSSSNSEIPFRQHLQSKGHLKKAANL